MLHGLLILRSIFLACVCLDKIESYFLCIVVGLDQCVVQMEFRVVLGFGYFEDRVPFIDRK